MMVSAGTKRAMLDGARIVLTCQPRLWSFQQSLFLLPPKCVFYLIHPRSVPTIHARQPYIIQFEFASSISLILDAYAYAVGIWQCIVSRKTWRGQGKAARGSQAPWTHQLEVRRIRTHVSSHPIGKLMYWKFHLGTVANEVIHPDDINVTFSGACFPLLKLPFMTYLPNVDIGGLDPIISHLREAIIYPLLYPKIFSATSSLISAPKGVLLYGPPGCGKTMLAKALAKESRATFINIAASVLTNKWYGESNKLVAGLFSLARKTQPSIIFIDEIDSFLRERTKGDHEVTGMMKAEFMTYVCSLRR